MCVFTLPSYPYVFKLIKDRIDKDGMDHATVRRKYQMVKLHDRVGRMADTWEYSQVALPRALRAGPAGRAAPPGARADRGNRRHRGHPPRHIERRMTPLNLYLQQAPDALLEPAVREYGDAIRQLAAANIFPATCCTFRRHAPGPGRVL